MRFAEWENVNLFFITGKWTSKWEEHNVKCTHVNEFGAWMLLSEGFCVSSLPLWGQAGCCPSLVYHHHLSAPSSGVSTAQRSGFRAVLLGPSCWEWPHPLLMARHVICLWQKTEERWEEWWENRGMRIRKREFFTEQTGCNYSSTTIIFQSCVARNPTKQIGSQPRENQIFVTCNNCNMHHIIFSHSLP